MSEELIIGKYALKNVYENPVKMHKGAKVLCIKRQYKKPTLWALVNPDNPLEERMFIIKETGSSIKYKTQRFTGDKSHNYIGTVLSEDETYVLHCFEVLGEK